MRGFVSLMLMSLGLFLSTASMAADDIYIAGTQPSHRPSNAPVITKVQHDDAWRQHALKGVEQPYPDSLKFLDNQGNWFNPFTYTGMTPPYDLRGWHSK